MTNNPEIIDCDSESTHVMLQDHLISLTTVFVPREPEDVGPVDAVSIDADLVDVDTAEPSLHACWSIFNSLSLFKNLFFDSCMPVSRSEVLEDIIEETAEPSLSPDQMAVAFFQIMIQQNRFV